MEKEQKWHDYPCPGCELLSIFVSTLSPSGRWVCTSPACYRRVIGNKDMEKWKVEREKLVKNGVNLRTGMKFIRRFIK